MISVDRGTGPVKIYTLFAEIVYAVAATTAENREKCARLRRLWRPPCVSDPIPCVSDSILFLQTTLCTMNQRLDVERQSSTRK